MRTPIFLVITALLVTGCKATVETEVSLSEIQESDSKFINGDLYVEVAACSSYEDSRKPSDSLVQTQQNVPSVFEGAEFVECFSKEFDSLAHFNIPIALDKDEDGEMASDTHVNLISNQSVLLMVGIPQTIKNNMERVKDNSFGMSPFDLKVNVKVNNDTGEDFPFRVLAAYVDGQPHVVGDLTSTGGPFVVTLSDVSVSKALDTGTAVVLLN